MHRTILILALALLVSSFAGAARAEAPTQKAERLDREVHVTLDYLLYLPPDYDKQDQWPLVLFLHGAGERGDDLDLVKKHGPPKLIEAGKSFPAVVVSPQCPRDRFWPVMTMELTALLDDVVAKNKVDVDRVYVTGLSMGGFGTWSLAAYTPDRFAAIIPICGGGEPIAARRLNKLPMWVFHGAKDPVVPLAAASRWSTPSRRPTTSSSSPSIPMRCTTPGRQPMTTRKSSIGFSRKLRAGVAVSAFPCF